MLTFGPRESINPHGERPTNEPVIPINVLSPQVSTEPPTHFNNVNLINTGDNASQSGYIAEEHTPTATNPENEMDSECQNFARLEKQIKESKTAAGLAYSGAELGATGGKSSGRFGGSKAGELNSSRDTQ